MTDEKLKVLWREERRLNQEWELAAWREDWTEAAEIRKKYNIIFYELITVCRLMKIIGERKWQSENWT